METSWPAELLAQPSFLHFPSLASAGVGSQAGFLLQQLPLTSLGDTLDQINSHTSSCHPEACKKLKK